MLNVLRKISIKPKYIKIMVKYPCKKISGLITTYKWCNGQLNYQNNNA